MKKEIARWVSKTLILAGIYVSLAASQALAAPALVKNVDEPGRTPWETRSQILPNAGGCYGSSDCFNYTETSGSATFDLRPVPAGKRWVVQMATGGLTGGQGRINGIELRSNRGGVIFDGAKWLYNGPFNAAVDFNSVTFSSNLFATFGPGETPTVRVTGSPNLSGYSVIVFSGYLIDAN